MEWIAGSIYSSNQFNWQARLLDQVNTREGGIGDLPVTAMRGSLFLEHERQFESRIPSSGISFYGQDPALPTVHSSSGLCRSAVPIAQTMQIPFSYAAAIVGIGGAHTFVGLVEPP
ncbi:hypothetical protein V6N13_004363 [Hibiscus sabdariffa]|uniref:Uncharacterized protein n=1 Tax=Hibiscus sabdariffa TaxID=183260 RepID=A0ABR2RYB2_9ROSI